MKYIKSLALAFALGAVLTSCSDDDLLKGNPIMDITGSLGQACFGDSLSFTVKASDAEVPLSTIHADLYFGDEMVSQEIIRTKFSGADYPVKIYVPYYANIPDGKATLRLTLQNINFTTSEQWYEVNVTHPNYPYLTLQTEDGTEYTLEKDPQKEYEYSVTQRFPQSVRGKIIAPAVGDFGNELVFGYENSEIKVGAEGMIPFSNSTPGRYTISFNTFSMAGSPFTVMSINGETLTADDETTAHIDMNLSKGDLLIPDGFPNFGSWWINPDFFLKNEDGSLSFNAYDGYYRLIADTKMQYIRVYKLDGSQPATLNSDGTGALWIIGEGIGHPSLSNQVGWTTENAICMAPVGEKTYQITLVGGQTVNISNINFKFFGQMGWGIELTNENLISKSDLIGVGDGTGGHDPGNLYLKDGVTLQDGGIYVITVDMQGGMNQAVMTVEYGGEQQFQEIPVYLNDQKMITNDNAVYSAVLNLTQGQKLTFREFSDLDALYYDPDYFTFDEDAFEIKFLPVSGYYNIVLNKLVGTLSAVRVNEDGSKATLSSSGNGALWLMGWGVGSPSQSYQFGWTPGAAYCMAEVSPGVFQFTGQAGPENGSSYGDRFRYDYVSFKFFGQDDWGTEFGAGDVTYGGDVALTSDGNFELSGGNLTEGATYRLTVDFTKNPGKPTVTLKKL